MWHHVERMTHCRIKKHPPQIKRGGCFFVFGKNFNLMTLSFGLLLFSCNLLFFNQALYQSGNRIKLCFIQFLQILNNGIYFVRV